MIYYIYKLISPSGKVYIGQTKNIEKRFKTYEKGRCKSQPKLYNSIKKYGWNNFEKEILIKTSIQFIDFYEKKIIEFYCCMETGLNCVSGGNKNKCFSEESKKKMSISKMGKNHYLYGKHLSDEIKNNMSIAQKGRPGKPHTEETKKKIGIANTGKHHSEAVKLRLSIVNKGKILSNNTKEKLRNVNLGKKHSEETKQKMRNRKHTDETKEKLRQAHLGKKHSEETKSKIGEKNKKSQLGKKHSEETKLKMRFAKLGKKHSEETKKKMSDLRKLYWENKKYNESISDSM